MMKRFLAPVLLCCSLPGVTQAAAPAKAVLSDFADEAAVAVRDEVVYKYASDGTGVRTETTVLRVQSAGALQTFGVLGFPYASGTQALDIVYVRVRKPDGTVVETPTGDAQDQPAPVEVLEKESAEITLESVNAGAFRRMNLLLVTWDTQGWVYFCADSAGVGDWAAAG